MKISYKAFFIVLSSLFIISLFIGMSFAYGNYLQNSNVEKVENNLPIGWDRVGIFPGVEFSVVTDPNNSNKHLMISNVDESILATFGPPNWAQNISTEIPRGQVVSLDTYIKTSEVAGFAAVALQVWEGNKIVAFGTTQNIKLVSGTQDWTELSFSVKVPEKADKMRVLCMLNGTGTAWFDNLRLVEGGEISRIPLQPGQIVGIVGGSLGAFFGITAGILGSLAARNRKKYFNLLIQFLCLMVFLGAVALVIGVYAYATNTFDRDYKYGLVLAGSIFVFVAGYNLFVQLKAQKQINRFKDNISNIE